ncbi:hypothetical protein PENTCL1PPCAC_30369, partial [Pristionchus entomophagus]
NRRVDVAAKGEKERKAVEPGFGDGPVNITKKKKQLLEGLKQALSKKDCFNNQILDNLSDVAGYLELSETGELIMYSSKVYGLRVDTTYNDAILANTQLQPSNTKADEKKSKAEQKMQRSTATQSLNLQRLESAMARDVPEGDRTNCSTPDVFTDGTRKNKENDEDGEGGSDDEKRDEPS